MRELKKIYLKTSRQTQNRLQEIFDSFQIDFNNLYSIADSKTKKRINTYIDEWQDKGLLEGQFGIYARNIKSRTRVKKSEILELLIYSAYIEEQKKLSEYELSIMKEDANYYYQEGVVEVNKTLPKKKRFHSTFIPEVIFLQLLALPNSLGYIWNEYVEGITKYNADQIYRQAVLDIQQNKKLEIEANIYQNLIQRQQDTRLNINGQKISGAIDLEMIGINNQAKLEGIRKADSDAKVRFLAVLDGNETPMCHSLADQEFYINKENIFDRFYGESNKELTVQRINCRGLVLGLNLPPIRHHFHWCRSSITYIDKKSDYYTEKYIKRNTESFKEITNSLEQYTKSHTGKMTIEDSIIRDGITYSVDTGNAIQDHSERELEVAKILSDKYGFRVKVLPRIKKQKQKTADYELDNEYWDLKSLTGKIDNRLRHKKLQANNFIFDVTNFKGTELDLMNEIYSTYKSDSRQWMKKIIIIKDDTIIHYFIRK